VPAEAAARSTAEAAQTMTDPLPPPTSIPPGPPTAPGLDVRRLLLFIAVIVIGLAYFVWDDVRDVLKPPEKVPQTVPDDVFLPANEEKIENRGPLEVTFSKIGAAVTHLGWIGPDGHREPLVSQESQTKKSNRAFVVKLPGSDHEQSMNREFRLAERKETPQWTELRFEQAPFDDGLAVVKTFRVYCDKPVMDLTVELNHIPLRGWLAEKGYWLRVSNAVGNLEDVQKDDGLITVRYNNLTDHRPVRRISGTEDWPTEDERRRAGHGHQEIQPTLEWVATTTRYFGLVVTPTEAIPGAGLRFVRTADCAAAVDLHVPPPCATTTFRIYAGPKEYTELAKLGGRQQEAVDYWFLGREVSRLLRFLHDRFVPNYGVAIILVTVLFRLLMWPVTAYNLRSLVDIRVANAKLAEIDAREPPRSHVEARAAWLKDARVWENVQRRATVGVFLPMLILLPALLILYYALDVGYEFHRQPLVLWITDISRRDPLFVLPLLMGLAMLGQMRSMSEDPGKERSWYLMPAAFTVLFAFFSAGLVLFWLTDTLVGWLQLELIQRARRNKAVDPAGAGARGPGAE